MSSASQHPPITTDMQINGPPYPPQVATLGGQPKHVDIGVSALFVAAFFITGAMHNLIYRANLKKNHFFIFSILTFGFCIARVVTFSFRIAWAKSPTDSDLAITANVLLSAGVVLLYIINLNFAQRILRAYRPGIRFEKIAFLAYYVSVVLVLIAVIVATVVSFFTLEESRLEKCKDTQRFGIIYFAIFCFLPVPIVLFSYLYPSQNKTNFGKLGTLEQKVMIVLAASLILTLETSFRAAVAFLARPANNPAWYDSDAAFYIFLPTLELVVANLYLVTRVDQRFFIDGKAESPVLDD